MRYRNGARRIGGLPTPYNTSLALLLCLLLAAVAHPQQPGATEGTHISHYYVRNQRVDLNPIPDRIALMARSGHSIDTLRTDLGREGWETFPDEETGLIEVRLGGRTPTRQAIEDLRQDPRLRWVEPVYQLGSSKMLVGGEVLIKLKEGATIEQLTSLNNSLDAHISNSYHNSIVTYLISLPSRRALDALDIVEMYRASDAVAFADPVLHDPSPFSYVPDDPYYPSQWGLQRIQGQHAWDYLGGAEQAVVAIVDSGVDRAHPDLQVSSDLGATFVGGLDESTGDGSAPCTCVNAHGTNVAGIAAATTNNNEGVAGVFSTSVVPIYVDGNQVNINVMNAIHYAWYDAGADVINLSLRVDPVTSLLVEVEAAWNQGRDGLGTVLVAAAGNEDGIRNFIDYPARYALTIAVGASDMSDERVANHQIYNPCQGQQVTWGSQTGPEMDILAPGSGGIYSSDPTGTCGYSSGAYFDDFSGTSAAAPFVAGVAAMLIGLDGSLSADGVRGFINDNADLTPGQIGWTQEEGWGRLNARRAVEAVFFRDRFNVHVNQNNSNSEFPNQVRETGSSQENGFNSLWEGISAVAEGGQLTIGSATYVHNETISKAMTLSAIGGTVTLIRSPS